VGSVATLSHPVPHPLPNSSRAGPDTAATAQAPTGARARLRTCLVCQGRRRRRRRWRGTGAGCGSPGVRGSGFVGCRWRSFGETGCSDSAGGGIKDRRQSISKLTHLGFELNDARLEVLTLGGARHLGVDLIDGHPLGALRKSRSAEWVLPTGGLISFAERIELSADTRNMASTALHRGRVQRVIARRRRLLHPLMVSHRQMIATRKVAAALEPHHDGTSGRPLEALNDACDAVRVRCRRRLQL